MFRHFLVGSMGFGIFVLLVGCGQSYGDLSGKVTYKGNVLRMGTVSVLGSDGITRASMIAKDGTYSVEKVAAGEVKLTVYSPDPELSQPHKRQKKNAPPPPKVEVDKTGWVAIPEKYADFKDSGLTFSLKPGPNSYDIELK